MMHTLRATLLLFSLAILSVCMGQESPSVVHSTKVSKAKAENYEIVMASLDNRWVAIRYCLKTGECSIFSRDVWVKIKEPTSFASVSNGRFVLKLTAFASGNEFAAIRMNKRTGASWFLKDQRWIPISEFED